MELGVISQELAKAFSGAESEHNWKARDGALQALLKWIQGGGSGDADGGGEWGSLVRGRLVNGVLMPALTSPRTTLGLSAIAVTAALYSSTLGLPESNATELLLSTLLRLIQQTRKLVVSAAGATLLLLLRHAPIHHKWLALLNTAQSDKNVFVRLWAMRAHLELTARVLTLGQRDAPSLKDSFRAHLTSSVLRALADASADVREAARDVLSLWRTIDPSTFAPLFDALDATLKRQVSRHTLSSHASSYSSLSASTQSLASPIVSTPSSTSQRPSSSLVPSSRKSLHRTPASHSSTRPSASLASTTDSLSKLDLNSQTGGESLSRGDYAASKRHSTSGSKRGSSSRSGSVLKEDSASKRDSSSKRDSAPKTSTTSNGGSIETIDPDHWDAISTSTKTPLVSPWDSISNQAYPRQPSSNHITLTSSRTGAPAVYINNSPTTSSRPVSGSQIGSENSSRESTIMARDYSSTPMRDISSHHRVSQSGQRDSISKISTSVKRTSDSVANRDPLTTSYLRPTTQRQLNLGVDDGEYTEEEEEEEEVGEYEDEIEVEDKVEEYVQKKYENAELEEYRKHQRRENQLMEKNENDDKDGRVEPHAHQDHHKYEYSEALDVPLQANSRHISVIEADLRSPLVETRIIAFARYCELDLIRQDLTPLCLTILTKILDSGTSEQLDTLFTSTSAEQIANHLIMDLSTLLSHILARRAPKALNKILSSTPPLLFARSLQTLIHRTPNPETRLAALQTFTRCTALPLDIINDLHAMKPHLTAKESDLINTLFPVPEEDFMKESHIAVPGFSASEAYYESPHETVSLAYDVGDELSDLSQETVPGAFADMHNTTLITASRHIDETDEDLQEVLNFDRPAKSMFAHVFDEDEDYQTTTPKKSTARTSTMYERMGPEPDLEETKSMVGAFPVKTKYQWDRGIDINLAIEMTPKTLRKPLTHHIIENLVGEERAATTPSTLRKLMRACREFAKDSRWERWAPPATDIAIEAIKNNSITLQELGLLLIIALVETQCHHLQHDARTLIYLSIRCRSSPHASTQAATDHLIDILVQRLNRSKTLDALLGYLLEARGDIDKFIDPFPNAFRKENIIMMTIPSPMSTVFGVLNKLIRTKYGKTGNPESVEGLKNAMSRIVLAVAEGINSPQPDTRKAAVDTVMGLHSVLNEDLWKYFRNVLTPQQQKLVRVWVDRFRTTTVS